MRTRLYEEWIQDNQRKQTVASSKMELVLVLYFDILNNVTVKWEGTELFHTLISFPSNILSGRIVDHMVVSYVIFLQTLPYSFL